jgi:anaerobic selenocysteine-containing dehydrogenase
LKGGFQIMPSVIPKPDGGKIVKTNCFDCHAKCGVLCHVDSKGKLVKVEGNPEDPRSQGRLCSKGRSAARILYDPHRLNYPLKRVGERGEGKWEQITWAEAMDTIMKRINKYKKEFGPRSIVFGQGTGRGTNQWNQRLGNTLGVNHWCCPAHACLLPIMVTQMQTIGMFNVWDGCDFDNAKTIVHWGANMLWSEATFCAGEQNRARDRAAKLIVIDPCFEHPMAAKADVFLGVRPGSDLALAMAWINIIIEENLYDAPFVKRWTTLPILIHPDTLAPVYEAELVEGGNSEGLMVWDSLTNGPKLMSDLTADPILDHEGKIELKGRGGKNIQAITAWTKLREFAADMPPEKAAEICWLQADKIREACIMYATNKPATIAIMQGIEEHTNARLAIHAITTIIAITGNTDVSGGNVWHWFWNEMLGDYLAGPNSDYHWQNKLGDPSEGKFYPCSHPKAVWNAILTGEPYPVKMYVGIQGNPISWSENANQVVKALKAIDFLVIMDYFLSPTAQLADIVLPSAHWTERDYIADEFCQEWLYGQQKAVEPLYERRSDITFMRELGNRLDPEWWPWKTDEELFDYQLAPLNITWKELKEKWVHTAYPYREKKYEEKGFATPSGRAELYSTFFQKGGSDPLPFYREGLETPFSKPEMAKKYPLVLTSGRRYPNYYHSAYRGIPILRELHPEPYILLNPEAGHKFGIKTDDEVWIESAYGKCKMKARLSNGVHPGVVVAPHGWWQGCTELGLPDYPDNIANINVVIGDQCYDPDLGAPNMRSALCRVYKA